MARILIYILMALTSQAIVSAKSGEQLKIESSQNPAPEKHIPLVYDRENTAAGYPELKMKDFEELPSIPDLPDPFAWADGSGRSTQFDDWQRHRSEIIQMLFHYEIGKKQEVDKKQISARIINDTLTVDVSTADGKLTLEAPIKYPEGDGPFPAIIGIGFPTGSLPEEI